MAFLQSGGSIVGSAQITDGAIVNADVNAAAAIAQSKIAASLNGNTDLFSIEQTVGTTHSLTTVAGQRVLVIAKGDTNLTAAQSTVLLNYNSVQKDIVQVGDNGATNGKNPFCLVYTEVPGAATQNITVTSGATLANVVITVIKFKSA